MTAYFWTTVEIDTLKRNYSTSGPAACHALLPDRTLSALQAKASELGLKAPPNTNAGKRFVRLYSSDERIDQQIRDGYSNARKRGDIKALCERLDRPAWWVQKRAVELGLTLGSSKPLPWSADELAILERNAMCTIQTIRKKLKASGHARSATAIAVQLKRRRIDRSEPGVINATELAHIVGVGRETVAAWCTLRGLKSHRNGDGDRAGHRIKLRDFRSWATKTRERYIDLRRVDQVEFWNIMFGEHRA